MAADSVWTTPFASVLFTTAPPVTIPVSPQGVSQVVEITPNQQWDVVISPNAQAPKIEDAHWDVCQLDTTPPTTSAQVKLSVQPSPLVYANGTAVRITANDMATGAQVNFTGRIGVRGYRVGPLG